MGFEAQSLESRVWNLRQGFSAKGMMPVAGLGEQRGKFPLFWQVSIALFWQNEKASLAV